MYGIIYKATNNVNGKTYIGQTIRTLDERKKSHILDLKKNMNLAFHHALRKYGVENFTWEIIDTAKTRDEINEKEIFWIAETQSFGRGYNMTLGGEGMSGFCHKEESKRKIGEANKGKDNSGENNPMFGRNHKRESIIKNAENQPARKRLIQLTLDGEFVAEYNSVSDGARAVGGDRSAIKKVCKGLQSHHKGYLWALEEECKGEC